MRIVIVAVLMMAAALVASCVTSARVSRKYGELAALKRVELGLKSEDPLPADVDKRLHEQAETEAEAEAAQERNEGVGLVGQIAQAVGTGNVVGGILGAIGLGMLGVRSVKKMRGAA